MKTIAMALKEIDSLKSTKQEIYNKQLKTIDDKISELNKYVYNNCSHNEDNLIITINTHEDEYGKYMPSWTEYEVECSVCKRKVHINKEAFDKSELTFSGILKGETL